MSSLKERLVANYFVDPETGCWNWTASLRMNGYGQIGEASKNLYTHRVSFEIHFGPIPDGLCVCHRCDNRACINPDHLFLGTLADNNADRNAKGRQARGSDITKNRRTSRGASNGRAKLSEADVLAIRGAEGLSLRQLADKYGVGRSQVFRIRRGECWGSNSIENRGLT